MKLLTRTNIYFIAITLIVFALGGKIFYEQVHSINKFDAEERLEGEKEKIVNFIKQNHALPQNPISLGDSVAFVAAPGNGEDKTEHVKLYNSAEKEYEPYQTLAFSFTNGDQFYRATIFRPLIESDDLVTGIVRAMLIIGSCLLVVLLLSNFIVAKTIWKPFYSTLERIKSFDIAKEASVSFDATNTSEFKALNDVLKSMTDKIVSDYRNLKEFTENASHEIQTPLAVIQSKLELLIQSENLSTGQAENVKAIYEAASRLSKLNQALLLLAKIENHQFVESKEVAINDLVEGKIDLFEELINHKNISVELDYEHMVINMHPVLADILVTNLISNAIKHNENGGKIFANVKTKKLVVQNTGAKLSVPGEAIFQRFKKSNQASDSLGLGLAIAKEICKVYGFGIQYDYIDNLHTITVDFK